MRKELPDDHVRITVRLPAALDEALRLLDGPRGYADISETVRQALVHYLTCPARPDRGAAREAYAQWLADHPSRLSPLPSRPRQPAYRVLKIRTHQQP